MKARKTRDIRKTLLQKGFVLEPAKEHHEFYILKIDGKKHSIYTYISHSISEYSAPLMSQIKKQLKFENTQKAEEFFDCHLTGEGYIQHLKKNGGIE